MDLISRRNPPLNRVGSHDGDSELHLSEAGVMLAVADWLFSLGAVEVRVHPDGLHMKHFDMPAWLDAQGFERVSTTGKRGISGTFERNGQRLTIHSQPGLGDVVTTIDGVDIEIEAKGGCINTRHPGQLSKLRKGLHEAVGQLMSSPRKDCRLIAAVPRHSETERLAERLNARCALASIEIVLVDRDGNVGLITG